MWGGFKKLTRVIIKKIGLFQSHLKCKTGRQSAAKRMACDNNLPSGSCTDFVHHSQPFDGLWVVLRPKSWNENHYHVGGNFRWNSFLREEIFAEIYFCEKKFLLKFIFCGKKFLLKFIFARRNFCWNLFFARRNFHWNLFLREEVYAEIYFLREEILFSQKHKFQREFLLAK